MPPSSSGKLKVKTPSRYGKELARTFPDLLRARGKPDLQPLGGGARGVLDGVGREQQHSQVEPERRQSPEGPFAASSLREMTDRLAWDLEGMWTGKIQVSFPAM